MTLNKNLINYGIYFISLILTGYIISYLSKNYEQFNNIGQITWFITFLVLTIFFEPTRDFLVSQLNLKPFKQWQTYLYIAVGLLIPYLLLKTSIAYEILMDQNLINAYKYGYLQGSDLTGTINAVTLAPIWEEIFFRGILLIVLSKLAKPILAIIISSIIFALFHPAILVLTFVAGVILSIMAIKTKSLVPGIVTHAIWNLYTSKLFLYF